MTPVDTAALLELEAKADEARAALVPHDDPSWMRLLKADRERDEAAGQALRPLITELEATREALKREREFVARMTVACDRTRAVRGRDEVAVKTSDWHALMSLAKFARRSALEKSA